METDYGLVKVEVEFVVDGFVAVGTEVEVDVEGMVAAVAESIVVIDWQVVLFIGFELVVDGHDIAVVLSKWQEVVE